jgi:hypothetical protein
MTYRPITDMWILARARLKDGQTFYGSYPGGFPERARALLGVSIYDSVLHVCGGKIKYYPYPHSIGPNDRTLDHTIAFRPYKCNKGICMSCIVSVNGKRQRACTTFLNAGDRLLIEPSHDRDVVRDLVTLL